ncbi:MAG: signal peptidase I [Bacteroidales bacterium]|nr:signal peptidase I [Bacteroidales bacterium]
MQKIRAIGANKWFKFALWGALYALWVIWLGNYWWLLGLLIVFDLYITKKVKWAFWKKRYKEGEKRNFWLDWLDAIIFALVAATFIKMFFIEAYVIPTGSMERSLMTGDYLFVSKVRYGPKVPQTPLSIPLIHNVTPVIGGESYLTWIQNDHRRMAGYSKVKRNDIVVFNFPHGDTVLTQAPSIDYHMYARSYGRNLTIQKFGPIVARPVDKRDHYVKRCVAIPRDSLEVKNGWIFINGVAQEPLPGIQNTYEVITNGVAINERILDRMGLSLSEVYYDPYLSGYPALALTLENVTEVKNLSNVTEVRPNIDDYPPDYPDSPLTIFPFTENFQWTRDQYGPLWIPKAGVTVELTLDNLPLYNRIISVYERNELKIKEEQIYINGAPVDHYTFKMDYYFMMGDNRHNSLDSRYWGFVPEDHIVGSPSFIWFSTDSYKAFPKNIRWKRLFRGA